MTTDLVDIMSYNEEECVNFATSHCESAFRGRQLFGWTMKGISDFDEASNLPNSFRDKLKSECFLASAKTVRVQKSSDGTRKYLFELFDGERIESVFMKYIHGNTVCVSTQAGCRMGCTFCASTLNGLKRSLYPSEMLSQIFTITKDTGERISNVVLMGMGEPLDNYDNVIKFLHLLNNEKGLGIGYRHVSLSTCGIIENMDRLSHEGLPVTLSVSLHASNGEKRAAVMPIARKYKYADLLDACKRYENVTKRRVSFEYALLSGVNDTSEDAHELGKQLKGTLCHVNLIPVNETERKNYKRPTKVNIEAFTSILESYKITVTVRRSLGNDISAACGQLKAEND